MLTNHFILAWAQKPDTSQPYLYAFLVGCGALAVAVILVGVPLVIARRRQHPYWETCLAAAFFWCACTTAAVYWTYLQQTQWSREYQLRLDTGYLDPNALAPRPSLHPLIFLALALGYLGVIALTLTRHSPPSDAIPPDPT